MTLAPAIDVDEEGAGGGAWKQSSMVVAKSEAVCTNAGPPPVVNPEPVGDVGGDTTECSSSFGDTCSGFQDAAGDAEPEVNSGMSAHADGSWSWKPPRKKVTAEWRKSVRPILWRCQWLELRMKELSSQVSKYDRELALNKKQKELQAAIKANGSLSESMQIYKDDENSIMKRRKRKRHEENLDTPLYINKHQILSYYHDKQNKGSETDGLLIDDDCGSTVSIRGGVDCVTLLDSEDYDVIFEQLSLKDILLTIDGVQSQVHLLQDRLSKACFEGRNLAFSEGITRVRLAQKRQHTQKRSSYTECRYTKPQKKKNLNVLLKDDCGPALSGRPLPDRESDTYVKDANRIAEERSGSREKAITMDLLLGIGNSIPSGYLEDLCKENADDILIDNQATNYVCQQFDKAKHLPSGTSSKEHDISAPVEVKNTYALVKVDSTCGPVKIDVTCALAVGQESSVEKSASKEPVSSGSKQELKSKKKRRKKGSLFTRKKQRKQMSKAPAAEEKTEGMPSATNNQTESMSFAVAKEKTEGIPCAATGPQTMTACSAGKKHKSVNEPADAKEHGSGNSFSASMEQKTGKPSSAMKRKETSKTPAAKEKTEASPSAANTQTESTYSAVAKKKAESTRFVATGSQTMTACSAGKKRKSVNEPADVKHESWNLFSASVEQKTVKPFSALKKQKTEKMSTIAKKHGSGNMSSAPMELKSGKPSSAVKQITETFSTSAKEHGSGNSASKEQKTGKPSSAMKRKETPKTLAAEEKTEATLSGANTQTESTPSAVAKKKAERTRFVATGPQTVTARSAGKKRKSVNEPADAKEHGSWNLFSALVEQKTWKPSSVVKKQRTEKSSTAAKKHGSGNISSAPMEQKTGKASSAVKKQETETFSTAAKEHGSGNSASKEQKTGKGSSAVKQQETETFSTVAKEHRSGNSASKEQKTGKGSSAVKKQETETFSTVAKDHISGNSASKEQKTGKGSSAVKKHETETFSTVAKDHISGNSASKEQKTGNGSSAVKKQETEHSAAANKQEAESASFAKKKQATENSSSKAKKAETASAPSMLQVETAVLVAVDSRRSQRVRKPKVFVE